MLKLTKKKRMLRNWPAMSKWYIDVKRIIATLVRCIEPVKSVRQ